MKIVNSLLVFVSVVSLISCASRTPATDAAVDVAARKPEDIPTRIKNIQTNSMMPGLQVVVTEGDRKVFEYVEGLRAVGQNLAVTGEDQWHIGSCTKPMTAFLIGQLIDQGKLKWTTTLAEIAPKGYKLHTSVQSIRIEQLLAHSSGLADVMSNEKLWNILFTDKMKPKVAREKLVRSLLKSPVRFTPGTKTEYSNSSYVVLGWIIEHVKKSSWESVTKKELFQKLGMNSCGFGPAGIQDKKIAVQPWGHHMVDGKLIALPPGPLADNPSALGPAGTVHCRVSDWHKFLKFYIGNEAVRNQFVSQSTYDKLLTNAPDGFFTYSTMGRGDRPWAKGAAYFMMGSNTFNLAFVAIAPSMNRIYTINTNAGHPQVEKGTAEILQLVLSLD